MHFDVVKVAAWIIVITAGRWLWDAASAILLRFVHEFFPEDPADRPPGWTSASAWRAMLTAAAWRVIAFGVVLGTFWLVKWLHALAKRLAAEKHLLQ